MNNIAFLTAISLALMASQALSADRLVTPGFCDIVVASRQNIDDVKNYVQSQVHQDYKENVRVAVTSNGWHAISIGEVAIERFASIKNELVNAEKIPGDSFCTTGKSYSKIIPTSEYLVDSSMYATEKPIIDCDKYESEIAACYAATIGPKACSQYVAENRVPGADTFSERVGISGLCTVSINSSFAKKTVPSDLILVVADDLIEKSCEQIDSDSIITQLFVGVTGCILNGARWAQKIDASEACARKVKSLCQR